MFNKYFMEVLGTFFLTLTICLSGHPLAIGTMLMALVYMGAHISGAHYNPAVSLAVFLRKKLSVKRLFGYMAVQFLAALLAATVVGILHGHTAERSRDIVDALGESAMTGASIAWPGEFLGTFILAFVVLMVGTSRRTAGNSYFGFAIALTVFGIISTFSSLNLALNPAVQVANDTIGITGALNADDSVLKALSQEATLLAHGLPRTVLDIFFMFLGGSAAAVLFVKMFPEDN
ncbi:porin [bacterium]|nr:porin [bacterium]